MIIKLCTLTLLASQIVLGYDHKIDLERCNKDSACCCVAPPAHLSSCTKCEIANFNQDPNGCSNLTCPDKKKWTTTGKAIIEGPAECGRSKSDPGKFAWFVGNTELKEAACMDKYDKKAAESAPQPREISELLIPLWIIAGSSLLVALVFIAICVAGCIYWRRQKKNNKGKGARTDADMKRSSVKKTSEMKDKSSLTSNSASAMSAAPGGVNGIEKSSSGSSTRSKKSSKEVKEERKKLVDVAAQVPSVVPLAQRPSVGWRDEKKVEMEKEPPRRSEMEWKPLKKNAKPTMNGFMLEDYDTWDNEVFTKKILPNFNSAPVESRAKWLRNHMCRFYAYCNTKKTPECGTFHQFWLLVKRCMDDKCEDAIVWTLLWRSAFTMVFSVIEKTNHSDEFRLLVIKPFENYMVEYLKKCDLYNHKEESRSEKEMRVICIEILLHTRHPEVTEELRKLPFNEKLEVPVRMLTAACLTRERDENKAAAVMLQFKRAIDTVVDDPHEDEGWGNFLQHCVYGLAAHIITEKNVYQDFFFDAMYQKDHQQDPYQERRFSPTDWLYAFKGALLHENSAKVALEKFKKLNDHCLLHIEVLLKKNHEDPTDLAKTREMYKLDMKEYTLMLADLLVGEDDFNDFKPHLRFVAIYIGEHAKAGEPLDEERIRERAINMGNMVRDRAFFKESCDSLKGIGAKFI